MISAPRRTIHLYGHLAEIGKEFKLAVRSPVEAVQLLEANFPDEFVPRLAIGSYQIIVGDLKDGIQCSADMLKFEFQRGDIHFVPVPAGSKGGGGSKGIMQVVIGAVIIATAFVTAGASLGFTAGIGAAMGSTIAGTAIVGGITYGQVALFGAALMLSGVAQILTPQPKENPVNTQNDDTRTESFFYNGAVNITKAGGPVPLVYGRVLAGSVVVAGGVSAEKLDITSKDKSNPLNDEEKLIIRGIEVLFGG